MSLDFTKNDDLLIIRPKGSMNALTCDGIQEEINSQLDGWDGDVILDLSDVPYISSHGLRVVIQTAKLVSKPGRIFACGLQPQIQQMFSLAGLDRIVEIRQSCDTVKDHDHVA